ncbi:MAG: hypothetical protein PHU05_04970 [Bacilli bacterium]|nr:hypothetical protein [Bacilli bacterium]
MMPKDGRCEEHGLYLYRTGFGWSCKLGCYYCDDPQKIKEGYIQQYKEELKDKINKLKKEIRYQKGDDITDMILELLK